MANVYDFRSGRSLKNVNAQHVGEELERIRADKGKLVPADVLEAAAEEHSPLHAAFEWDDSAAAHQHRLNQARRLIVSIRILNAPTGPHTTAYVSVKSPDKGRSYLPTADVMTDDELASRVLAEVRQFIESLERRYHAFEGIRDTLTNLRKNVG
jgi:hypothetical protein